MNTTERHIIHLLETHGIAVVPGLGVFMQHRRPAAIEGEKLTAPASEICFEPAEGTTDDTMLVRSIVRATGCDIEASRLQISDDVNSMRYDIASQGYASIGTLGRLTGSPSGVLSFVQETAMPGSWLEAIELHPLVERAFVSEEPQENTEDKRRELFLRSLRRTASSAAAIAGFALIAFIASQLPQRDSEPRTTASIVLNENLPSRPIGTPAIQEERAPMLIVFNTPNDGTAPVEAKAIQEQKDGRYCLVVASLASRTDAEKFINGRAGLNILEKDGRYRVYTLSAETAEDLQRQANASDIYATYPSAWICRR